MSFDIIESVLVSRFWWRFEIGNLLQSYQDPFSIRYIFIGGQREGLLPTSVVLESGVITRHVAPVVLSATPRRVSILTSSPSAADRLYSQACCQDFLVGLGDNVLLVLTDELRPPLSSVLRPTINDSADLAGLRNRRNEIESASCLPLNV